MTERRYHYKQSTPQLAPLDPRSVELPNLRQLWAAVAARAALDASCNDRRRAAAARAWLASPVGRGLLMWLGIKADAVMQRPLIARQTTWPAT